MTQENELKKAFQKRNFYTTKDSGSVFVWALLLPLMVSFLFCYVCIMIFTKNGALTAETENFFDVLFEDYPWLLLISFLLTHVCFVLVYVFYHKMSRVSFKATNIHFKKTNWVTALLCAAIGIFCVLGMIWLIEGCFGKLFEVIGVYSKENPDPSLPLNTWWWFIINLIVLGVVPAICEELLFRGIIFQGLKEKFSKWPSIIISALLFALIHQDITQFIYPFLLGIVFATTMERTNNLIYPILIHMFNNFTTLTINYLAVNGVVSLSFPMTWWFVLIAILAAVATFVVLFLVNKFYLQKKSKIEVEKEGDVVQAKPISVGKWPLSMLICVVLAVVIIVINAVGA